MLLGIGYLPTQTGPRFWRQFDAGEIREDFSHIAELGLEAVRVPLFWHDFQPGVDRIAPRMLDRFGAFLDIAADHHLKVVAGLWAGFWDGALWWPDWGVNPAPLPPHWPLLVNDKWISWGRLRHPFTDERMRQARELLIRELVAYYAGHPALIGWEPLPGFGRLSAASDRDATRRWLDEVVNALDQAAPAQQSVFLLAFDALENAKTIGPKAIIEAGGRPGLSLATFASDRRHLPLSIRWLSFALELMNALAGEPVSLYLAGLPTTAPGERSVARDGVFYASEEEGAEHLAQVIALARQAESPSLWLWRWADIPEAQWQAPPYDRPGWRRHTGLLRADGSEKQLVQALKTQADAPEFAHLDMDLEAYLSDPYQYLNALWQEFSYKEARKQA
jgi:endo-1,4-beta-mannosidase